MHIRRSGVYEVTHIEIDNSQCKILINMQNKMVDRCYKHINKYYKTQCEKNLSNYIFIFTVKFHIIILVSKYYKVFAKAQLLFFKVKKIDLNFYILTNAVDKLAVCDECMVLLFKHPN